MRLKGKTAFITGGNSGIGLATARLFIAEGAKVTITGRNQRTLDAAAAELGPDLLAVQADLQDVPAIERAVSRAVEAFGKLDIVFANAGVVGATPVGGTSLEAFERIIKTNLTGAFFTVQAAAAHLNDRASIILNGSVHAVMGMPGFSAYAATKGAVRSMTRVLASELAPRGIRVNQVTPGAHRTGIWSEFAPDAAAMDALEKGIAATVPLRRMGEADEAAAVVLFLASDASSNVTAAEIVVDGGMTGAPFGAPIHGAR
ncbi:SDR family oxidoreductase [Sorangium sp. So ce131]|uniref:SDR family oxidoreductase n=1 Tax=Sorangium sp. So ce131 TaxID=3133282 RepID=UPI003F6440B3